ncbi:MAG: MoxR family ATPase [Coriobacteriaceae bacterium]|nr:MoxR family ATPase [Coriobacteriaceae bacterium]
MLDQKKVDASKKQIDKIVDNIDTVIIGKREQVTLVVLALIAKGHVLLEDLPGTGKTTLVSALARSVDCSFNRIQFTPDVMPSDVSGFSIFNQKTNDFEFRPGGVMANLVLADEINRASAKTQSALLEAMEERQVTVDSNTYKLEEPFMVMATQNPIEQFGTYPLPEAQIDRFLIKLSLGYPDFDQEVTIIDLGDSAKQKLSPVVSSKDILTLRESAADIYISPMVMRYIVEIVTATRDNPEIQIGSSTRGGLALASLGRTYALSQGRNYVLPDDIKYLAPYILCHRISLAHEAKVQGRSEQDVIGSILSGIAVPYYDEDEVQGKKKVSQKEAAERSKAAAAKQPATAASKPADKPAASADKPAAAKDAPAAAAKDAAASKPATPAEAATAGAKKSTPTKRTASKQTDTK